MVGQSKVGAWVNTSSAPTPGAICQQVPAAESLVAARAGELTVPRCCPRLLQVAALDRLSLGLACSLLGE